MLRGTPGYLQYMLIGRVTSILTDTADYMLPCAANHDIIPEHYYTGQYF